MRNRTLRYLWLVLPLALGACSDSDDDDDSPPQEPAVEVAVEEPAPPLGLTVTLDQGELQRAYDTIDSMEPELYETTSFRPRQQLHWLPVAMAALLYTVYHCLATLRAWRGLRREEAGDAA